MLVLALATKTSSTTTRTKNLLTLACEHVETDHSVCLFPIDIFVLITHICSTRVLSTQLRERLCVDSIRTTSLPYNYKHAHVSHTQTQTHTLTLRISSYRFLYFQFLFAEVFSENSFIRKLSAVL